MHPQGVFYSPLTQDEATWIVLWTQGLCVFRDFHAGSAIARQSFAQRERTTSCLSVHGTKGQLWNIGASDIFSR
jgi:hypothetical protein